MEYNASITAGMARGGAKPQTPLQRFVAGHPNLWLGLMLLGLHAAIAWGIQGWWSSALLLAHIGLFLMWQPVWRGEGELEPRYAFLVVIVGVFLAAWSNWWLVAVWLAVLFGLIGGSVPGMAERRQRLTSIIAALYLLSLLLMWVVPHLFTRPIIDPVLAVVVRYGLLVLPIAIILIRTESIRTSAPVAVDLFYSVILFLLVVALVLGSFVVKEVSHGNYLVALAQTLLVIALLLIALSWLWNPHSGFAGVGTLLSRYLMSLGLPFEVWVQGLASLAEREGEPQRFLSQALQSMLDLPWVTGLEWQTQNSQGEFGVRSEHVSDVSQGSLKIRAFTRWDLSPAMLLHLKLLTQMVGHFHEAKRREQLQRQNAYTQAIYETGARLTHDVKNLLQSLRSLCSAVESSDPGQSDSLQALLQRQLPQITQRLNSTLDKLKTPQQTDAASLPAGDWWGALIQRHTGRNIQFAIDGAPNSERVPGELFDSVADNLIDNALNKATDSARVQVRVTFLPASGGTLAVCDTGEGISADVVSQMFEAPVASQTGLGVGLYHAAKQASQHGYRLALAANEPGSVCFVLTRSGNAGADS